MCSTIASSRRDIRTVRVLSAHCACIVAKAKDQWSFLASVERIASHDIEPAIFRATGGAHPLDVTFVDDEDSQEPLKPRPAHVQRLTGPMPEAVAVTLANMLYLEKAQLPQALANRLVRLAAFQNPEFYRAQAMRLPTWDKPRVIGCAEEIPNYIALPRGCVGAVQKMLDDHEIRCDLRDERNPGEMLDLEFVGSLRLGQQAAVDALMKHDAPIGVYRSVGFKHGTWHDAGWWQKTLQLPAQPISPRSPE
jgi:hypothetical protein